MAKHEFKVTINLKGCNISIQDFSKYVSYSRDEYYP